LNAGKVAILKSGSANAANRAGPYLGRVGLRERSINFFIQPLVLAEASGFSIKSSILATASDGT
jgi:hypothetical protein